MKAGDEKRCGTSFPTAVRSAFRGKKLGVFDVRVEAPACRLTACTSSKTKSPRRGFTLIEVMLAILILGLGLGVLMTAAGRAVAVAAKAKNYETARRLIYRLELEEPLQLDDLKEDHDKGSFGRDYPGFSWDRAVTEYGEESDRLFLVTTRITWRSRRKEAFEQVQTLIHEPSALRAGFVKDTAGNALF